MEYEYTFEELQYEVRFKKLNQPKESENENRE